MAGVTVLEVPQWQGSGSPTAPRLRDGAAELAGMIPADQHLRVGTGGGAGEAREGVAAHDLLVANLRAARTGRCAQLERGRGSAVPVEHQLGRPREAAYVIPGRHAHTIDRAEGR